MRKRDCPHDVGSGQEEGERRTRWEVGIKLLSNPLRNPDGLAGGDETCWSRLPSRHQSGCRERRGDKGSRQLKIEEKEKSERPAGRRVEDGRDIPTTSGRGLRGHGYYRPRKLDPGCGRTFATRLHRKRTGSC